VSAAVLRWRDTDPEVSRARLLIAAARFHREDRALPANAPTTDAWMRALIDRQDAMRALRALAPADPLLEREDRADADCVGHHFPAARAAA
jgi:hypothetical protein